MSNFDRALDKVFAHEGGWANHPADRGGRTMYGITEGTLAEARRLYPHLRLPLNVRDLTRPQARLVYLYLFWERSQADRLPWKAAYATFDAAVQHGWFRAVKWLQRGLEITADGIAGPQTHKAIEAKGDCDSCWVYPVFRMLLWRALFYIRILASPSQAVFARGWANRLEDVKREVT